MARFECEKHLEMEGDERFVRLVIYLINDDGSRSVDDITHHEDEAAADDWLLHNWGVHAPPKLGETFAFAR